MTLFQTADGGLTTHTNNRDSLKVTAIDANGTFSQIEISRADALKLGHALIGHFHVLNDFLDNQQAA
jgi:hypothetical protein